MIPADSNLHHSFFPKLDFNQGESTFFNPLQKSLQSFANSFLPEESEKWGSDEVAWLQKLPMSIQNLKGVIVHTHTHSHT